MGNYPTYVNQYETQTFTDSDCSEPDATYSSVCCPNSDGNNTLFNLYQNVTQHVLYLVTPDNPVRQFEISIQAAHKSGGAITVSLQPWQSYPDVANALDPSTQIAGSVKLSNIGEDAYNVFVNRYTDYGGGFNVLTKTSLDDEGEHALVKHSEHNVLSCPAYDMHTFFVSYVCAFGPCVLCQA